MLGPSETESKTTTGRMLCSLNWLHTTVWLRGFHLFGNQESSNVAKSTKVQTEAQGLLEEAMQRPRVQKRSWWNDLGKDQQDGIIEAVNSLNDHGLPMVSLVRAIQKRYGVTVKESSVRLVLRELLRDRK